MSLAQIRQVAAEWIASGGKFCDAWATLDDYCFNKPVVALRIIEEIHHRIANSTPIDYELMAQVAAGPLETLLAHHGDTVIDQVEQLAYTDPEFRKCLTGVWQNAMSPELFSRVQRASDPNFRL